MDSENHNYVAAYESHHVAYLTEFDSYEKAADFLHSWAADLARRDDLMNALWSDTAKLVGL